MSLLEYEQYLYYPRSYFFAKKSLTGFLPGIAGVAMNRLGKTGGILNRVAPMARIPDDELNGSTLLPAVVAGVIFKDGTKIVA